MKFHKGLTIIGDLNSDLLDPTLQQTKMLTQMMRQLKLQELVQSPTRITHSTSSQLDVILTNSPSYYKDSLALPYCNSDHHLVVTHLLPRGLKINSNHNVVFCRKFCYLDTNILASILSDEVWDQVLGFESIEDSVTCFNLMMQALLDAMVPLKKVRIKTDIPPWA